jgi:hypothetical protein
MTAVWRATHWTGDSSTFRIALARDGARDLSLYVGQRLGNKRSGGEATFWFPSKDHPSNGKSQKIPNGHNARGICETTSAAFRVTPKREPYMTSSAEACSLDKVPSPMRSESWISAPDRALRMAPGDSTPISVARSRMTKTGADAAFLVSSGASGWWACNVRDGAGPEAVSSSKAIPNRSTIAPTAFSSRASLYYMS